MEDLLDITHKHQLWLSSLPGGTRAVFYNKDFREVQIAGGSLRRSIFVDCNFSNSLLTRVDFTGADLSGSNFHNTNLYDCDLWQAKLTDCIFTDTKFNKRPSAVNKYSLKLGGGSVEVAKGTTKLNCIKKANSFWLLASDESVKELGVPLKWWHQFKPLIQLSIMLKDLE